MFQESVFEKNSLLGTAELCCLGRAEGAQDLRTPSSAVAVPVLVGSGCARICTAGFQPFQVCDLPVGMAGPCCWVLRLPLNSSNPPASVSGGAEGNPGRQAWCVGAALSHIPSHIVRCPRSHRLNRNCLYVYGFGHSPQPFNLSRSGIQATAR